jgi:hypothetical protein
MGKLFSGVLRSYVIYHLGQVKPDNYDIRDNSHILPPFTERSISCSYWGVLSCPIKPPVSRVEGLFLTYITLGVRYFLTH